MNSKILKKKEGTSLIPIRKLNRCTFMVAVAISIYFIYNGVSDSCSVYYLFTHLVPGSEFTEACGLIKNIFFKALLLPLGVLFGSYVCLRKIFVLLYHALQWMHKGLK